MTDVEPEAVVARKRTSDGCQNCRTNRVKCNRGKPSCGCCMRKQEICNYSKIQFNTVNKRTHDKRTGRKSKTRPEEVSTSTVVETTLQEGRVMPRCLRGPPLQVIFENPGLSAVHHKTAQLPTPLSSPSSSSSSSSESSRLCRSSNIHELLWPQDQQQIYPNNPTDHQLSRSTSSLSIRPDRPEPNMSMSESTDEDNKAEKALEKEFPTVKQEEVVDRAILCHQDTEKAVSTRLDYSLWLSQAQPESLMTVISSYASPDSMKILKHSQARQLLHHYLHRSVATLHPQQGCVRNVSAKLFLPYCLLYPVALEGILAFSASQLAVDDPSQAQAFLYHKMCSIQHLNRLVYKLASTPAPAKRSAYSLDLMVSVLSQISLSVSESGTDTWTMHCGAAYSMMALLPTPRASDCAKDLQAYLYCRLLKYICFAEIARPTNNKLDLGLIEGSTLDGEFGVPATGLKLAVMISRHVYRHNQLGLAGDLHDERQVIDDLLQEYLAGEVYDPIHSLSDCQKMNSVWRTTIWLYYNRIVNETDMEHDTSVIALSRIVNYLKTIPITSIYNTALAFTLLTIAPLLSGHHTELRHWLANYCVLLAKNTNTRNFLTIEEFAQICWVEIDRGLCRRADDVQKLAEATGLVILAA